jgi:hypothetical protein
LHNQHPTIQFPIQQSLFPICRLTSVSFQVKQSKQYTINRSSDIKISNVHFLLPFSP